MIVSRDTNPEREVYYLGGIVLNILKNHNRKQVDFFDIFQKLNESEQVSVNLFSLTLDWLYLLGAIESKNGEIEKCF